MSNRFWMSTYLHEPDGTCEVRMTEFTGGMAFGWAVEMVGCIRRHDAPELYEFPYTALTVRIQGAQ